MENYTRSLIATDELISQIDPFAYDTSQTSPRYILPTLKRRLVVKKKKRREQPLPELEGVSFDAEGQVIINNDDEQGGDKPIDGEKDLLSVDEMIMLCKKVEVRIVSL